MQKINSLYLANVQDLISSNDDSHSPYNDIYKKVLHTNVSLVDRTEKSTPLLLNRDFLSAAGLIVDPSEDFVISDRPKGYSPKDAKGDPIAGVKIIKANVNSEEEVL